MAARLGRRAPHVPGPQPAALRDRHGGPPPRARGAARERRARAPARRGELRRLPQGARVHVRRLLRAVVHLVPAARARVGGLRREHRAAGPARRRDEGRLHRERGAVRGAEGAGVPDAPLLPPRGARQPGRLPLGPHRREPPPVRPAQARPREPVQGVARSAQGARDVASSARGARACAHARARDASLSLSRAEGPRHQLEHGPPRVPRLGLFAREPRAGQLPHHGVLEEPQPQHGGDEPLAHGQPPLVRHPADRRPEEAAREGAPPFDLLLRRSLLFFATTTDPCSPRSLPSSSYNYDDDGVLRLLPRGARSSTSRTTRRIRSTARRSS